jgi:hypothetical protein
MTEISFEGVVLERPAVGKPSRMRGLTLVREVAREAMYGLAGTRVPPRV